MVIMEAGSCFDNANYLYLSVGEGGQEVMADPIQPIIMHRTGYPHGGKSTD
jgi:hypothetical protein